MVEELSGMITVGFITKTILENDSEAEEVIYGVFINKSEAIEWANKLINATVIPIYSPAFNRG